MTESPPITVALPTCEGARHLREALAGIRAQEGVAFDLLVSDDRSDDDTLAIVRDEMGDRARILVNPERLGLAGNWNRCVERSRTEWVAIFHQDDAMRPGHLASHRGVIEVADDRLGLVAGPVEMIDEEGRALPPEIVEAGGLDFGPAVAVLRPGAWGRLLAAENPLRCSAVTTRQAAHQAVGGFDPSYRYAVDWDFWARVARGWSLAWIPGPPTVAMRWHPASETHRFRTGSADLDEQVRLLGELHRLDDPGPAIRRKADARLARAFLHRAHVALKGGDARLARRCLARSLRMSPGILATILVDPRLAAQMATLAVAPRLAARWLARRSGE